jgi:hypothetical protein
VSRYEWLPDIAVEVSTYEVKQAADAKDLEIVYETAAHGRWAHRASLVVEQSGDTEPVPQPIVEELRRFRLGLYAMRRRPDGPKRVATECSVVELELGPQVMRRPILVLGYSLEVLPSVVPGSLGRVELPDLRFVGFRPLADASEVSEQEAGRLQRVVARSDCDDKCEPGLNQDSQLARLPEHAAVCRDEAVPSPSVVVEGEQQLPIVEVRHAGVDLVHAHQLRLDGEFDQRLDDRLGEVVTEREEPRHHAGYAAIGWRFRLS